MNAPKSSKKASVDFKALKKEFHDIAPDVVKLMLESCNGDASRTRVHLQEMQVDVLQQKMVDLAPSDNGSQALPDSGIAGRASTPSLDASLSGMARHQPDGTVKDSRSLGERSVAPADGTDGAPFWQPDTQLFSTTSSDPTSQHRLPRINLDETQSSCPTDKDSGTADHVIQPLSQSEAVNFSQSWKALEDGPGDNAGGKDWTFDQSEEAANQWESNGAFPMQLTLDKALACQLIMSFGLMQVPINVNHGEDLKVELDRYAAYALYLAWKSTQEKYIAPTSSDEQLQDSQLAEALQEVEHEMYAEGTMKQAGFSQIMDETYALNLMDRESDARGMQINSALKYQSESDLESKWVDVLLKAHNVDDDSALPRPGGNVRNVYANSFVRPIARQPDEVGTRKLTVEADAFVPATMQLNVRPVAFPGTSTNTGRMAKEVDYYGHRQEALELQRKAVQLGARAGSSFRDKKLGGGAAAYYLQKSHETRAQAKDAHLAASLDILSTQNLNASDGEVDLHGLRAEEVSYALDLFLQRKHSQKELKIISGVGRHSKNGAGTSEVRRHVAAYLKRHSCVFEEGPPDGVFYVQKWPKLMARPP